MFLPFFQTLRSSGIPVSLREYLAFLEALHREVVIYDVEDFYLLARTTMVKDERHLDRFDRAFASAFSGLDQIDSAAVIEAVDIPADWLEKLAERHLDGHAQAAACGTGCAPPRRQ